MINSWHLLHFSYYNDLQMQSQHPPNFGSCFCVIILSFPICYNKIVCIFSIPNSEHNWAIYFVQNVHLEASDFKEVKYLVHMQYWLHHASKYYHIPSINIGLPHFLVKEGIKSHRLIMDTILIQRFMLYFSIHNVYTKTISLDDF